MKYQPILFFIAFGLLFLSFAIDSIIASSGLAITALAIACINLGFLLASTFIRESK